MPDIAGLCGRYDGDYPCDRPAGHLGGCAGRLTELHRLEAEYRYCATEMVRYRHEAVRAEGRAVRAEQEAASLRRELAHLRQPKSRWKRLLHH